MTRNIRNCPGKENFWDKTPHIVLKVVTFVALVTSQALERNLQANIRLVLLRQGELGMPQYNYQNWGFSIFGVSNLVKSLLAWPLKRSLWLIRCISEIQLPDFDHFWIFLSPVLKKK